MKGVFQSRCNSRFRSKREQFDAQVHYDQVYDNQDLGVRPDQVGEQF